MNLTAYRHQHNLTASEMARRLGVAHTTVARIEDGTLKPSAALLMRIVEVTDGDVTPNDILIPQAHPLRSGVVAA